MCYNLFVRVISLPFFSFLFTSKRNICLNVLVIIIKRQQQKKKKKKNLESVGINCVVSLYFLFPFLSYFFFLCCIDKHCIEVFCFVWNHALEINFVQVISLVYSVADTVKHSSRCLNIFRVSVCFIRFVVFTLQYCNTFNLFLKKKSVYVFSLCFCHCDHSPRFMLEYFALPFFIIFPRDELLSIATNSMQSPKM